MQKEEDLFYIGQCKQRSIIRLKESRPKPIDILTGWIIALSDQVFAWECRSILTNPTSNPFLKKSEVELKELLEDIRVFLKYATLIQDGISGAKSNAGVASVVSDAQNTTKNHSKITMNTTAYITTKNKVEIKSSDDEENKIWFASEILCINALEEYELLVNKTRTGVDKNITKEMNSMFSSKTFEELLVLQTQIESKLANEVVDSDYWDVVLKSLKVWMARVEVESWVKRIDFSVPLAIQKELHQKEKAKLEVELYDISMNPIYSTTILERDRHLMVLDEQQDTNRLRQERRDIAEKLAVAVVEKTD